MSTRIIFYYFERCWLYTINYGT